MMKRSILYCIGSVLALCGSLAFADAHIDRQPLVWDAGYGHTSHADAIPVSSAVCAREERMCKEHSEGVTYLTKRTSRKMLAIGGHFEFSGVSALRAIYDGKATANT